MPDQPKLTDLDAWQAGWIHRSANQSMAALVDQGPQGGDNLVTLPPGLDIPGSQLEDDVRAIAAVDLLRWLIAEYEAEGDDAR